MFIGAAMINANQMLIFGGMMQDESGDTSEAYFFDVNTNTFSEALPMKRE